MQPVSGNSPTSSTPRPRHWCIACGDTIIPRRTGNPPKHCSIECLEWDLEDARKSHDRERASKLYCLRSWWRKRIEGTATIVRRKRILTPRMSA